MKKLAFLCAGVVMMAMTSCSSTFWTATQVFPVDQVTTNTVADLQVGNKVTYTYQIPSKVRKGGLKNCRNAAIAAMLKENGNADVIVAPEYTYDNTLTYITVTGYPAKYTNFRAN